MLFDLQITLNKVHIFHISQMDELKLRKTSPPVLGNGRARNGSQGRLGFFVWLVGLVWFGLFWPNLWHMKCPGQELNSSHSRDQRRCSDCTRSLSQLTTRKCPGLLLSEPTLSSLSTASTPKPITGWFHFCLPCHPDCHHLSMSSLSPLLL